MTVQADAISALVTTLQSITIANGYATDVDTVEIGGRSFDEVTPANRTYIGIIPNLGTKEDHPGFIDTALPVDLICYLTIAKTTAAELTATSNLEADIRRAIYATANLSTAGVVYVQVTGAEASTGHPESVLEGIASLHVTIVINYEEEIAA